MAAARENDAEQQLELGKDAFYHPPSSTFFKRILSDTMEEHDGKVSIGGRTVTNLRFDGIEEQELEALVESLEKNLLKVQNVDKC